MPLAELPPKRLRQYKQKGPRCPIINRTVRTLSDYLTAFSSVVIPEKNFWFRGHAGFHWKVMPSALRYSTPEQRSKALSLVSEFRRFAEFKLPRPPGLTEDLKWIQVAQHYGLPTRLLDWTQNAAVALFFACCKDPEGDGLVVILNPIELNQSTDARLPRVFNFERDSNIIQRYFKLDGRTHANGRRTIAINPTWNTERIAMQQGAFTLHGSRKFDFDRHQASSLLYVPILRENKVSLLSELGRVGIREMVIFPEPEHVCAHLKRNAGL